MNAIKSLLAVAILCATGVASATTIGTYIVSSTALNPMLYLRDYDADGNPIYLNLNITGNGAGDATLSDTGVLTMHMHTETLIDISPLLTGVFVNTITDSTTVLSLTGNNYDFNINKTGSTITTTSCINGPLDNVPGGGGCAPITSSPFPLLDSPIPLFGTTSYYSTQQISLGPNEHGYFNIETVLYNGLITTAYSLSPVPIPATAWLFGSGLIGLVGAARRRLA